MLNNHKAADSVDRRAYRQEIKNSRDADFSFMNCPPSSPFRQRFSRSTIHDPRSPILSSPIHDPRSTIAGFTLIELMAALAVFVIMAFALYMVFDRSNKVWLNGENKADQYQNARTVLDMMAREITSAVIATGGPTAFSGTSIYRPYLWSITATAGSSNPIYTYDQDQIFFIMSKQNALYEVGYFINDQTSGSGNTTANDDVLVRAYTSCSGGSGTGCSGSWAPDYDISSTIGGACGKFGSCDNVGFKVTDLDFAFIYKSGGSYTTALSWDSRKAYETTLPPTPTATTVDDGRLPDFIEVTIRVADKALIEQYNGSPPKASRKAFTIKIPINQRSFRNGT